MAAYLLFQLYAATGALTYLCRITGLQRVLRPCSLRSYVACICNSMATTPGVLQSDATSMHWISKSSCQTGRAAKATEVAAAAAAAQRQRLADCQPDLAPAPDPDALALRLLAMEATTQRAAASTGSQTTQQTPSFQQTPNVQQTLFSQACHAQMSHSRMQ